MMIELCGNCLSINPILTPARYTNLISFIPSSCCAFTTLPLPDNLGRSRVCKAPALPIPNDITLTSRNRSPRYKLVPKRVASIAASGGHGEVEARSTGILREADATDGLLALGTACSGVGDGDLVDRHTVEGGVAGLVDALVAICRADHVVALALAVNGGSGCNDDLGVCFCDCVGTVGNLGVSFFCPGIRTGM